MKKDFKINNLTFYPKKLEKEQIKPKTSRWKEIINIRLEINKTENGKTTGKKISIKPKAGSSKRPTKLTHH